ncbi:hypothetical protein C8Q76DRAFT_176569 [Earliella scabrosa]|nr:hypothetical protein C8Q76DRAFT_176569 [Earliella scabrosa]
MSIDDAKMKCVVACLMQRLCYYRIYCIAGKKALWEGIIIMTSSRPYTSTNSPTRVRKTRKMLDRLVIITIPVNTGVWTAGVAIIDLTWLPVYCTGAVLHRRALDPFSLRQRLPREHQREIACAQSYNNFWLEYASASQWTVRDKRSHLSNGSHSHACTLGTTSFGMY